METTHELPAYPTCGQPRTSVRARFCGRCGAKLDSALTAPTDLTGPPALPDPEDPELRAYLEALSKVAQARGEVLEDLRTVLPGTYAERRAWLEALGRAAGAMADALEVGEVGCRDPATLPGGAYGRDLYEAGLHVTTEVFPRIGAFPPSLTEAETLAFLAVIQPEVDRVFAEVHAEVEELEPPASLRDDHDAALGYLTQMASIAADITAATTGGDAAALDEPFARSAEPGRQLERRLSSEGKELLAPVLPP